MPVNLYGRALRELARALAREDLPIRDAAELPPTFFQLLQFSNIACLSTAAQALLRRLEEQSDGARHSLRGALRRLLSKTWSVGLIFAKFPMITQPSSAVPLEAARPCGHEARRRGGPGLRRDARGASSTDRPSPSRPRPSPPLP